MIFAFATLASASTFIVGCGKQGFEPRNSVNNLSAPGTFFIPPKVDILIAEDDTGSISEAYSAISHQVPAFLKGLQVSNFDYHFALTPLTTNRAMSQVTAGQYDNNWGSQWLSPYPGAVEAGTESVSPGYFTFPDSYSSYVNPGDISNAKNGAEPGFQTIYQAMTQGSSGSSTPEVQANGFVRSDSLLAIFVIGNGDDTSGINYCKRVSGNVDVNNPANLTTVPCESVPYCTSGQNGPYCRSSDPSSPYYGTQQSSFANYLNKFRSLKSDPSQVKFYSAVATQNSNSCLGSRAYQGIRYQNMAANMGGANFDLCTQPIDSILAALHTSLQGALLNYESDYVFMDTQPDPTSIQVTRYAGGDKSNPQTIAMDSINGWTYDPSKEPLPVGTCAVKSGTGYCINKIQQTTYGVVLHGSAILRGMDSASITFQPAGFQQSAK